MGMVLEFCGVIAAWMRWIAMLFCFFLFFSSRRRHTRSASVSWARRCVYKTACRLNDINYSRFINGLRLSGIELDRKILANLAMNDSAAFASLVVSAKAALK